MKTLLVIVLVIALVAGGAVWFLHSTTARESARVHLPLTAAQRNLIGAVPENAEVFALIPTAAALHAKLRANPVTREPLQEWSSTLDLPQPWMLGSADVIAWKAGKQTSYAVYLDPFRALLARFYLRVYGGVDERRPGGTFVINPPGRDAPVRLAEIERLAAGLPPSDVLVVQLGAARGTYPPIGRPALTAVDIDPREIVLTSRAADTRPPAADLNARLATNAVMSATFSKPPRFVSDLDRLTGSSISTLLGDGGSIAIYDVDTGTLLPRPKGIIVTAVTDEKRAAVSRIRGVAEAFGEIREQDGRIMIALDRTSMAAYAADTSRVSSWPAAEWVFRGDPQRMVPLVDSLADSTGLRLAASRTYRAARDLRRWIRYLAAAGSVEAVHSRPGEVEELRVRIVSK